MEMDAGDDVGGGRRRALLAAWVVLVLLLAPTRADATDGYTLAVHEQLHPGVTWTQLRGGGPLSIDVAKVHADAPVRLVPVISDGELYDDPPDRRHAPVTSMCSAVGGVVCVNADFWVCPSCGPPGGGVVVDGVPLRTPTVLHPQVTMLADGRLVTDDLHVEVRLEAVFEPDDGGGAVDDVIEEPEEPRVETVTISEINRHRPDGLVLYSPTWAGSTHRDDQSVEAVFAGPVPAIGNATEVGIREVGGHDRSIPDDGFVIAAAGPDRNRFAETMTAWRDADRITLHVGANLPAVMSTGGHPVILRDGHAVPLDQADPKVRNRHPRTLLGWNASGDLWVLTIDGRQPGHSIGVTLGEAVDHLRRLGATDAMNLDGGGSSTFVTAAACPDGRTPCIRNRPSDGRERHLSTALALVPTDATPVSTAPLPAPPPPPPTTAAPATIAPPPTTTTTTTTTATTTTTTSTIVAPTTTIPTTTPPTTAPLAAVPQLASGSLRIEFEDDRPDRTGPTALATSALAIVAVLTVREWERSGIGLGRTRPPATGR